MSVKKQGDRWFVVKSNGELGKRGFLSKASAEAAQSAGRRLGGSDKPAKPGATMADPVGTRSKTKSTLGAKVAMEPVLVPRASDLASLLEGLLKGLEPGATVPDFTSAAGQDSDDVQIGVAMGEALGAYMASRGMTEADWAKLMPKALPEGPGFFDNIGLGGGVIEAAAGAAGNLGGQVLGGLTGGLLGGDNALIDIIPGEQGGVELLDVFG